MGRIPSLGWVLGGAVAALCWLGWVAIAPAAGFPDLAPVAMFNLVLVRGGDPGSLVGWVLLVSSLGAAASAYAVASGSGLLRASPASGALYGLALWFLTGAILMPLMGLFSPALAEPAAAIASPMPGMPGASGSEPMRATFMMLHLGALAPVAALIGWIGFGTLLGAVPSVLRRGGA